MRKGQKATAETRLKQSIARKGRIPWNKGKKMGRPWNYRTDREQAILDHKFRRAQRKMLHRLFNFSWKGTIAETEACLGYTRAQLKAHLESLFQEGMTWENYGRGGWHIDHIQPVSSFPIDTPPSVVNALSNLQPLWERDNLRKYNKPSIEGGAFVTEKFGGEF